MLCMKTVPKPNVKPGPTRENEEWLIVPRSNYIFEFTKLELNILLVWYKSKYKKVGVLPIRIV